MGDKIPLERMDNNRWRIPQSYNAEMRVPGMVYADDELIEQILADNALQQVANVATLPGIVGYSLAMPDIHWGYGFPVGGVAEPMRKAEWYLRAVLALISTVAFACWRQTY